MPHKEMVSMVGPYHLINMLRNIKLIALEKFQFKNHPLRELSGSLSQ